ncbi:amidophosphoribosyltransferase [Deinococcus metallilatus]|uniref:Amidophosphoribosyltransferase n=1 Tax=Deinococcus metallilatus TaxID=1211322 RepID=A0AAJ5F4M5_9DEIO|nr:amidophosphoribosyltransferase [Deinococcus metallilatus]MBB5294540.1 amidophosphoribosyltransferase [Deinococcus metallilatus]QBY07586.1 amidophosphoribosyltransferase [Deinococcus metallilatus]RXJ14002.1 amidophosphoribosyltransferase [Deinococcus metallilatus]TLK29967.1 amidophosphoribosyltransferase [Deinococcus metallilatus]GMA15754.1 amidophosphoribosyltransferase [Deinococcus metallilatus]
MIFDPATDKPQDECGVFGLYSPQPNDLAWLTYLGLFALQHRGQEAAGMCVSDGEKFHVDKDLGLVTQVFDERRLDGLRLPNAHVSIGHVRYSTTGSNLRFNAQPLTTRTNKGILGLAHNGNFVNAREVRSAMLMEGALFQTTNDSEVMLNLIARESHMDLIEATAGAMKQLKGGYACVLMSRHTLLGFRDPHGVRPLVIGQREDGAWVLASEPCALYAVGAKLIRDVQPGELVWFDRGGLHSLLVEPRRPTPCSFEWIYFARSDGELDGVDIHASRIRMGEQLAREKPVEADIVVPVPDSGIGAAIGYARESGIPFDYGLYKNPYAGRTFIAPTQEARELKVKMKLSPTSAVRGKRVILVDDSIVRGTTSRQIVNLLREAGAREVHFRVSSPPITHPCFYGIDTAARKELVASTHSVEEIRELIGADTLAFISEPGLRQAIGGQGLCGACFTGEYPAGTPLLNDVDKLALEV